MLLRLAASPRAHLAQLLRPDKSAHAARNLLHQRRFILRVRVGP